MQHYTYEQFKAEHPDDATCLTKVMVARYGGTEITCPGCKEHAKFHPMGGRRAYACQRCGHHLYPCVGTPFEKSRTPLSKWLFAIWLFTTSRHGIAARELERQIGVTHKCAWRMAHEIRKHMAKADTETNGGMLGGHVEIDETYVGGRQKRIKGRPGPSSAKTPIVGLAERGGRIRAEIIPDASMGSLHGVINKHVRPATRISTDEWSGYRYLGPIGFDHRTVAHGRGEHVRGDTHVNSVEGFWSRLKLSIRGTHVHVSRQHLSKYVGEFSYRYNMRKRPHVMFHDLISSLSMPSSSSPST